MHNCILNCILKCINGFLNTLQHLQIMPATPHCQNVGVGSDKCGGAEVLKKDGGGGGGRGVPLITLMDHIEISSHISKYVNVMTLL